jgi:RNA polymerase sigma factor (sigma-70 family)
MKSAVSTSDTLGLMLRDLDQFPMPDHEQQVELAKRVVAGDDAARKQMVAANLRLVVHWARRYQDRGVDMADLVQEGTFGLMRAVDKFDWERGFRFSTYATWWIRQALQRAVQQHGRTIRIPLEVGEQIQRLELTKAELATTLGRAPTVEELDEATGMTADERESLEDVARVTASLDQPAALESSTTLGELVATSRCARRSSVCPTSSATCCDCASASTGTPRRRCSRRPSDSASVCAGCVEPRRRRSPPSRATSTWWVSTRPLNRPGSPPGRPVAAT